MAVICWPGGSPALIPPLEADYYRQGLVSLTRVQQGITSWIAHAQHAQTWGLRQKLLGELTFTRETRHAV